MVNVTEKPDKIEENVMLKFNNLFVFLLCVLYYLGAI